MSDPTSVPNTTLTTEQRQHLRDWAQALRSGKYSQANGQLRTSVNGYAAFCCLGVACDMVNPSAWGTNAAGDTEEVLEDCCEDDPPTVQVNPNEWMGAEDLPPDYDGDGSPIAYFGWADNDPKLTGATLKRAHINGVVKEVGAIVTMPASWWNDTQGATFEQIADMIEATYNLKEDA